MHGSAFTSKDGMAIKLLYSSNKSVLSSTPTMFLFPDRTVSLRLILLLVYPLLWLAGHVLNVENQYALVMLPSGRAQLWTHFFSTHMNLSKGNMLCRNTGPRISISFTRCTRRCVIMLKNDGKISTQSSQNTVLHRSAVLSDWLGQLPFEKLRWGRHIASRWLIARSQAESPATQWEEVQS